MSRSATVKIDCLMNSIMCVCDDDDDDDDVHNLSVDVGAGEETVHCGSGRPPTTMNVEERLQLTMRSGT